MTSHPLRGKKDRSDTTRGLRRREFLNLCGWGAASLGWGLSAPHVHGKTSRGILVESPDEYSGFLVERLDGGLYPYDINPDVLKPMSGKMTVFSRNGWDPSRRTRPEVSENIYHTNIIQGRGLIPDQTRLDYAFMAASWHSARSDSGSTYSWTSSGMVRGLRMDELPPWDPSELDMTWSDATAAVKHAALFFGASLAGTAELNPLWIYSEVHAPTPEHRGRAIPVLHDGERMEKTDDAWYIPRTMNRVVALAFEEDFHSIANSPGRLASAATGNGYSRMAVTAPTLANFIRALGYRAIPAGNGLGPSIPIAIDAGLGELGRNGLLVTPRFGPRVRLAKVITDMPLEADRPISFGVTEFCESCMLCTQHCPSESISSGPRTWEGTSVSNNPGVFKWYIHPESCYDFNGFSCSNCKRVCPFNKPNNSWLHRLIRASIKGRSRAADKVMVTLDQASGYGEPLTASRFWNMNGNHTITAREMK